MARIEKLVPFILKWEGGFSNHPDDKGGATMKGVTFATFQQYRKDKGMSAPTVEDLKNISNEEWTAILKEYYWDKFKADSINSQMIANIVVDWAWGSGPVTAVKQVQKLIGVAQDGIVGANTLEQINNFGSKGLFDSIWLLRKDFLIDICLKNQSQLVFLKGWLNRLYDISVFNTLGS